MLKPSPSKSQPGQLIEAQQPFARASDAEGVRMGWNASNCKGVSDVHPFWVLHCEGNGLCFQNLQGVYVICAWNASIKYKYWTKEEWYWRVLGCSSSGALGNITRWHWWCWNMLNARVLGTLLPVSAWSMLYKCDWNQTPCHVEGIRVMLQLLKALWNLLCSSVRNLSLSIFFFFFWSRCSAVSVQWLRLFRIWVVPVVCLQASSAILSMIKSGCFPSQSPRSFLPML